MAPLIVMLVSWAAARLAGFTGVLLQTDSWSAHSGVALAAMFVFTGVSHFHRRTRRTSYEWFATSPRSSRRP
jgi:hypothetical protein